MQRLHIANIDFEEELAFARPRPLARVLEAHPISLQLQFLPFLYGRQEDCVLLSTAPPLPFLKRLEEAGIAPLRWELLSNLPEESFLLDPWGASQNVTAFAEAHHLFGRMPTLEIVKEVNSKVFSFTHAQKLPDSALIYNEEQLKSWLSMGTYPKVLKTCFGVSGKGHFLLLNPESTLPVSQLYQEWRLHRPLIGEPWVKRIQDFSTQWIISEEGKVHYFGATLCENDTRGQYKATRVGVDLLALDQHLAHALPLVQMIADKGYFGHIGIDAFLYEENQELRLHPIVEINARKTMGWAALQIRALHFPNTELTLNFSSSKEGWLPQEILLADGSKAIFKKQLAINPSTRQHYK